MNRFSIRRGNLEVRSCDAAFLDVKTHTRAEIVAWTKEEGTDENYCYTIASFKKYDEGFDLKFVGPRPFEKTIDKEVFMVLAEIGRILLMKYFLED